MSETQLTADRSVILSKLLNEVTGTEEAIRIRQDYCRIEDCIKSMTLPNNSKHYFTGSKSEGLNLKDSDEDYMIEVNHGFDLEVVQSLDTSPQYSACHRFYLCTENTRPGFALLRYVETRVPHPVLFLVLQLSKYNHLYMSSNLFVETCDKFMRSFGIPFITNSTNGRQGPSLESWHDHENKLVSGSDYVPCLRCRFWPDIASEWVNRTRKYGWPTASDIKTIVDFGCHLVAIGYPHSDLKLMEWRLSFSIAERTLVWSFNHIQMQCYAVMKIFLKEYIKKKCSEENQILCSYFIKTFLFWKFETTERHFWRQENFGECLRYLLYEFHQCLLEGKLRHYFIPTFNLLSVKLTEQAQSELLQVYDNIVTSDIGVMKECKSLRSVWSNFLQSTKNQMRVLDNARKSDLLKTDELLIHDIKHLYHSSFGDNVDSYVTLIDMFTDSKVKRYLCSIIPCLADPFDYLITNVRAVPTKTCLKPLFIKRMIFEKYLRSVLVPNIGEEHLSRMQRITHYNRPSFDISTLKIWCAIFLIMKRDYTTALSILKELEDRIPLCALYESQGHLSDASASDAEKLYAEEFVNSDYDTQQRAMKSWMFTLEFIKSKSDALPLAIQIELYFSHVVYRRVRISPFTCLYYLMFLCHHELKQYVERNRVLHELESVACDTLKCGRLINRHHAFNIAGHCFLIAGQKDLAYEMFVASQYYLIRKCSSLVQYNSAMWYLLNFYEGVRI